MKLLYISILFTALACIAGLNNGATLPLAEANIGLTSRSDLQARSQNIYIANGNVQDIYVMATLDPDWALADFITNIVLLVVSFGRIQSVFASAAGLSLKTPRDLFVVLELAAKFFAGAASADIRAAEAAQSFVDSFKNTSILIKSADHKNVYEQGFLEQYLTPNGIAGMLGADTVTLMVMSGDGKQVAMWNSGPDDSWIATNDQKIVRSVYGTLWDLDPDAGSEDWPVASA